MPKTIVVLNSPAFNSGSVQNDIFPSETPGKFEVIENDTPKKKRKKKSKIYFTSETEDSIVAYADERDPTKKNIIYNERIKYSFEKLAENIINTFSFSYIPESYCDIKTACVSHMLLNIGKYKKSLESDRQ